jgi:hypothetical protein
MQDAELQRLQEIERQAHARFLRLSRPGIFPEHPEIARAAKDLWIEASDAVRAHRERSPLAAGPQAPNAKKSPPTP